MPGEGRSLSSRQTQDVVRDQESGQADLADYFGSLPHTDLLKSVARRIVDRRVLHLIKMWLECPVEETDQRGRTTRTTEARDSRRGLGLEQSLGTRLVTYADDLVIPCAKGAARRRRCTTCARSWAN